eukprot:Filipodium_phascolosomae@DN606_c0_g1_i1.p1
MMRYFGCLGRVACTMRASVQRSTIPLGFAVAIPLLAMWKHHPPVCFSSDASLERPGDEENGKIETSASSDRQWSTLKDEIDSAVKSDKVVLFMKGTPDAPQCGFSAKVVAVLNQYGIEDYSYINVLEHPAVRNGIKRYSEWPTIPQLYISGEFIGGCDIVLEMHEKGELEKLLGRPLSNE